MQKGRQDQPVHIKLARQEMTAGWRMLQGHPFCSLW